MPNLFAKLFSADRLALWKHKDNRVIGIDLGHSSAKVVQLRNDKGRVILETYGEMALGPYGKLAVGQVVNLTPTASAALLKDLFAEANVTAKTGAMSIPLRSSLLTIIELPDIHANKLNKVVPIEARKYVPVPITEVLLDWWVIPKQANAGTTEKKTLEVLIAAIHKETIAERQEIGKLLGVPPLFLEIETFSAIRSVFSGELTPTVILDIGAGTTKMAIIDYGIVRLSHTISKGSQDITIALSRALGVDFTKAEEIKRSVGLVERVEDGRLTGIMNTIVDYTFSEVNKILAIYQAKQRRAVSKITLIGNGALLKGLLGVAEKSFEMPVEIGRPFSKVEYPAFLENVLNATGPGFAVAMGVALRALQGSA